MKITIHPSETADTRSCDFSKVSKETLLASSRQHIGDVQAAMGFFGIALCEQAEWHDVDKLSNIDGFHRDFLTGFNETTWWDEHRKINRHHLLEADGIPKDVNLIDVLEMIADCVMVGMARTGKVYPLNISPEVLMKAFENTVEMLKSQVVVVKDAENKGA